MTELEKGAAGRILETLAPALEAELEQARAAIRQQVIEELQVEFDRKLQHACDELKAAFDDQFQTATAQWAAERARLQDELQEWQICAQAQPALGTCNSQAEILIRFLHLASPFAGSVAVYVAKSDQLVLWKARGPRSFPETASQSTMEPEVFFKSVAVRDRTVAAVCAAEISKRPALDFLIECLERSIEIFGLKLFTPVRTSA